MQVFGKTAGHVSAEVRGTARDDREWLMAAGDR